MTPNAAHHRSWLTRRGALRVPQVTAIFRIIKELTTAMGESTSDYLVTHFDPVAAVLCCFGAFLAAIGIQVSRGRYVAWAYWLAVGMVGIFGTMAADALHVALHLPYVASTILYAVALAVVSTFARGTALGDLTATTFGLGYLPSAALFTVLVVRATWWR